MVHFFIGNSKIVDYVLFTSFVISMALELFALVKV